MHCTQHGSDNGSTCIIKCRRGKSLTTPDGTCLPVGPRYQWDQFEGCTCPVCKCQCNKISNVKDFAQIVLALAQQLNVLSGQEPSTGTQLQALLGSAMTNGIRAASDAFSPAASDANEVVGIVRGPKRNLMARLDDHGRKKNGILVFESDITTSAHLFYI